MCQTIQLSEARQSKILSLRDEKTRLWKKQAQLLIKKEITGISYTIEDDCGATGPSYTSHFFSAKIRGLLKRIEAQLELFDETL